MTLAAAFKANPETLAEAIRRGMLFFPLGWNLGQYPSEAVLGPTENEVLMQRETAQK